MLGAVIIVVIIVVALPSAVLISGGFGAAILGFFLEGDAARRHAGSELLDLDT